MYLTKIAELNLPGNYSKEQSKWIHAYINTSATTSIEDTLSLFTDPKQLKDSIQILSFYGGGKDVLAGLNTLLKNKGLAYGNLPLPKQIILGKDTMLAYTSLNKTLAWVYDEMLSLLNKAKADGALNTKIFNDMVHFNTIVQAAKQYIKQNDKDKTPIPEIKPVQKSLYAQIKADPDYANNSYFKDLEQTQDAAFVQKEINDLIDDLKTNPKNTGLYDFIPGWIDKSIKYANTASQKIADSTAKMIDICVDHKNIETLCISVLQTKKHFDTQAELVQYILEKGKEKDIPLAQAVTDPTPSLETIKTLARERIKWFVLYSKKDTFKAFFEKSFYNAPIFKYFPLTTYSTIEADTIQGAFSNNAPVPFAVLTVNEKEMAINYVKNILPIAAYSSLAMFQKTLNKVLTLVTNNFTVDEPYDLQIYLAEHSIKSADELTDKLNKEVYKTKAYCTNLFYGMNSLAEAQTLKRHMKLYTALLQIKNDIDYTKLTQLLMAQEVTEVKLEDLFVKEFMIYPSAFDRGFIEHMHVEPEELITKDAEESFSFSPFTYLSMFRETQYMTLYHKLTDELDTLQYDSSTQRFDYEKAKKYFAPFIHAVLLYTGNRLRSEYKSIVETAKNDPGLQKAGYYQQRVQVSLREHSQKYLWSKHLEEALPTLSDEDMLKLLNTFIPAQKTILRSVFYSDDVQNTLTTLFTKHMGKEGKELDVHLTPANKVRIYKDNDFIGEYPTKYAYKFISGLKRSTGTSDAPNTQAINKIVSSYTDRMFYRYDTMSAQSALKVLYNEEYIKEYIEKMSDSSNSVFWSEDTIEFMESMKLKK